MVWMSSAGGESQWVALNLQSGSRHRLQRWRRRPVNRSSVGPLLWGCWVQSGLENTRCHRWRNSISQEEEKRNKNRPPVATKTDETIKINCFSFPFLSFFWVTDTHSPERMDKNNTYSIVTTSSWMKKRMAARRRRGGGRRALGDHVAIVERWTDWMTPLPLSGDDFKYFPLLSLHCHAIGSPLVPIVHPRIAKGSICLPRVTSRRIMIQMTKAMIRLSPGISNNLTHCAVQCFPLIAL